MKSTMFVPPHRLFLTSATRIACRTLLRTVSLAAVRTFYECVSSSRSEQTRALASSLMGASIQEESNSLQ